MTPGEPDTLPSGADAVVVGAGAIGAAVALELARTGRRVMVVDKFGGVGHGSTSASSAVIRFNYSTWDGVATAWESRHCWARWAEHLGVINAAGPWSAAFDRMAEVGAEFTVSTWFDTQVTRAARRFPLLRVSNRPTGIAGAYDAADDWAPSTTAPICPASTSRWARAATSSRTLRRRADSSPPWSSASRPATTMTAIRRRTHRHRRQPRCVLP
ncbi:FAD-dependent oxidoreductase [Streptomyces sp. 6-11-2]|uniref:FAD-dependent oxidoreductase n=1 Tax=Streptomyces sp. 6-11-2 TaxID=2585753 RepID=UPI00116CD196|nr:FAD-dependent oxidoreductase [Streptomyces sp. 6-11-2]GED83345.1 hypothetical protein TNCT6_04300 [Streptomyces sp. 6-11-2]